MVATPQQRLPLWRAFSEFFLDTERDAVSFEYVAREIRASGLSLPEAESVLWNEVFPALAQNLLDLAGVLGRSSECVSVGANLTIGSSLVTSRESILRHAA